MNNNLTAIILPMYNEEISIFPLRNMFAVSNFELPESECRIVIINDGSTDNTLSLVKRWAEEDLRVTVITHPQNMGVGQAILTGFAEAIRMESDCVVTMDADASHPGTIIKELLLAVNNGADIAIASRFAKGGIQIGVPLVRKVYSLGARIILSLIFPLRGVSDYTVGFRAYKTSLLKKALSTSNKPFLQFSSFASSVEILLKIAPFADKIVEVPMVLRYDQKQSPSKLKFWDTICDYFRIFLLPKKKCTLGKGLKL